jgi:Glutathione S-transferase, N-terminal domain
MAKAAAKKMTKKVAAKKSPAKKAAPKTAVKPTARKVVAKKATRKAAVKKSAVKKPAKKAAPKKAVAKKAAGKKVAVKKAAVKKAAPVKRKKSVPAPPAPTEPPPSTWRDDRSTADQIRRAAFRRFRSAGSWEIGPSALMRASAVGLSPSPTRVTMLRSQSRSWWWPRRIHGSSSTSGRRRTAVRFLSCSRSAACRTTFAWSIGRGEPFEPSFLAISPNSRSPAIIDPDGPDGAPISVFESRAILQYLARKRSRFGGDAPREQVAVSEWLFWQLGGLGPMAGQAHHFRLYAPGKIPYAIDRYTNEVNRPFDVMNKRLASHEACVGRV